MKTNSLSALRALFCCVFFFGIIGSGWGQTTVNYDQRVEYYDAGTVFTSGTAGTFNQGTSQVGMYANGGTTKQVVAWRTLKTAGNNTGSNRSLQVGDEFRISVSAHTVVGEMGFALLSSPSTRSSWADRLNNAAVSVRLSNYGNWYATYSDGTTANAATSSGSNDIGGTTSYKNFVFTCLLTAPNRMNITITDGTTTSNLYDVLLNNSNAITEYSIFLSDDWNGVQHRDIYWNTNSAAASDYVKNTLTMSVGSSNSSFTISEVLPNGLEANSTSTASVNALTKIGSGSLTLSGNNTYTGTTTISGGMLLLGQAGSGSNTPLGTTAGTTSVSSGGVLNLNGFTLATAEGLTLNGTGISSGGALINSSTTTASTWAGTVALGSASSVGGAGNLTLSGVVSGAFALTKVGAGTLTLSNSSNSYSGGTVISGGTVSVSNAGHLGNTSGAITLGSGSTSATLDITTGISRTALNVTDGSSAGVINVASSQTFTLSNLNTASGINAATKIGKSGAGTLTLSGAGTYVGQTQIGQGTVIVSNNTGLGTNTTTANRAVDLGLNVGDVSQGNSVSLLLANVSINNSIYVAPNTSSATRTLGTSGATPNGTLQNEIYLDGNVTCAPLAGGTLTISGKITGPASPSAGSGLIASSGITTLTNIANDYKGTTTISSGAQLRLNPSNNATFASQVVLNGGTLSTTSIESTRSFTSSSTLNLTSSSTIALGSNGHTLTFQASNGEFWTSGQTITITGWTGTPGSAGTAGRIFVGSSSSGLSAGQLVQIFFSGVGPATILSTGEIVPATASTIQFRSRISGDWATAATWEYSTDGTNWATSGIAPSSSNGAITILNGHTVTISTGITIDEVTINSGGTVTHSGSSTVTLNDGTGTDLTINGTWTRTANNYTISPAASATISVGSTGIYEHNIGASGGSIPTASWNANSILRIKNDAAMTSAPSGLNQTFGIVEINIPNQTSNWEIDDIIDVTNELRIVSTGSGYVKTTINKTISGSFNQSGGRFINGVVNANTAFTISGNLTVSGGSFEVANNTNTSTNYIYEVFVTGNVVVNGGTIDLNKAGTTNPNAGRLYLGGDLTVSSGSLTRTQTITNGSTGIYFNGNGSESFIWSGGTIDGQVLKRFYYKTSSGPTALNETYSASTAQTTINGTEGTPAAGYAAWPSTGSLINDITVNNSAGVSLSSSKVVNGALTLTSGKLAVGANTLTLNGTVASMSAANSLTGSASSNLTIGGNGALGTLFFDQATPGTTNVLGTHTINRINTGSVTLANALQIATALVLTDGTLSLGANTLTINGSVSRTSGNINASSGTVAFGNASNLSLPTSLFTGTIANLSKTAGAGTLTINDALTTVGNLSTTASTGAVIIAANKQLTVSGTLTNNGTLTLENGATLLQTGSTANAGGGTYNVKQGITGSNSSGTPNGRGWYMGSPVSGANSNLFAPTTSTNLIYHWKADQATPAWQPLTAGSASSLDVGKGYAVRIGETSSTITFSSTTLNNAPSSSEINVPCYKQTSTTYQGYNLVCNPFPSYLDWNDVWTNTNATNFESTIYYRVANGSNVMVFDTYNALNGQGTSNSNVSQLTATRYIPPMQAFWVKLGSSVAASSNAVNLTLDNSMRDHYTSVASGWTAGLKSTAQDFPMFLRLNIEQGSFKDQMLVFLKQQASSQYDAYDSEKMFLSGYPQVYTKVGTRKLVFNGLNSNKKITVIPVIVDIPTSGVFTFRADEFNVEDGLILLEDKQEGITQDLTINDVYTFYADAGTISNRFFIRFHQLDPSITAQGPSNSWVQDENEINEGGSIVVATNGRGKVTIQQDIDPLASEESHVVIRDAAGREVLRDKLSGLESIFQLDVPSGVYFVEVQLNGQVEIKKIFVQQ